MKHSDDLIVAKIFCQCIKKPKTLDELSYKIYKNHHAPNVLRVYRVVEALISEKILVPKMNNGSLMFQVDKEIINELIR